MMIVYWCDVIDYKGVHLNAISIHQIDSVPIARD